MLIDLLGWKTPTNTSPDPAIKRPAPEKNPNLNQQQILQERQPFYPHFYRMCMLILEAVVCCLQFCWAEVWAHRI